MQFHGLLDRTPMDLDVIGTFEEYNAFLKVFEPEVHYPIKEDKFVAKFRNDGSPCIVEFEVAWPGSTGEELLKLVDENGWYERAGIFKYPSLEVLLALKLSHRYLKNSPHFIKTMRDIQALRKKCSVDWDGIRVSTIQGELANWLEKREEATYTYKHPKLNQKKKNFFDTDGVMYTYDHDAIHELVAIGERPAYLEYKPETEDVWCSWEMWDKCSLNVKLNGAFEEAMVLCIERWCVPNNWELDPYKGFLIALEKVCTSITSGWFREFCWEHYDMIKGKWQEYGPYYIEKFRLAEEQGLVKLHEQDMKVAA
jgi:hypothetical protein